MLRELPKYVPVAPLAAALLLFALLPFDRPSPEPADPDNAPATTTPER